jgi:hypothetical protein
MRLQLSARLLPALLLLLPLLSQAQESALPLEQQLFNDFAARMEQQMHRTAGLLNKIAQSKDPQEREQLMKEYWQSMRTTNKIHHLMHQIAGGDDAAMDMGMMGKKKAGGMMKGKKMGGMGCCKMMMGKKGGKQAAEDGEDANEQAEQGEAADEANEPAQAGAGAKDGADEHAGHH